MPTPLNPHIDLAGPEGASTMVGQGVRDLNEEKWRQLQYGLEERKLRLAENESSNVRIANKYSQKYSGGNVAGNQQNYSGKRPPAKIDADTLEKMLKLTELYPDAGDFYDEKTGEFKVDEKAVAAMQEARLKEKKAEEDFRAGDRSMKTVIAELERRRKLGEAQSAESKALADEWGVLEAKTKAERDVYEFKELQDFEESRRASAEASLRREEAQADIEELKYYIDSKTAGSEILKRRAEAELKAAEHRETVARIEEIGARASEARARTALVGKQIEKANLDYANEVNGVMSPKDRAEIGIKMLDRLMEITKAEEDARSEAIRNETAELRGKLSSALEQLENETLTDDERDKLRQKVQEYTGQIEEVARKIKEAPASEGMQQLRDFWDETNKQIGLPPLPNVYPEDPEENATNAWEAAGGNPDEARNILYHILYTENLTEESRKSIKEAIKMIVRGWNPETRGRPVPQPPTADAPDAPDAPGGQETHHVLPDADADRFGGHGSFIEQYKSGGKPPAPPVKESIVDRINREREAGGPSVSFSFGGGQ